MSGVYIHIPFCHKKCNYCKFYSVACFDFKSRVINSIIREIKLQKEYLSGDIVETIYFGGGTPSLLDINEIESILKTVYYSFNICDFPEITLEANPIDLVEEKIIGLKNIGINRLSIGVQTFNESFLRLLNRQENIKNIYSCINNVIKYGFKNFNLDLIFSIPGQKKNDLLEDLEEFVKIKPTHISAYCLSIEPMTVFDNWIKKNIIKEVDDDISADFFLMIDDVLVKHGYKHYEISNYSLPGFKSIHNSNYWDTNKKYLGVGPSAHSYNLISRQYNIEDNLKYIFSIEKDNIPAIVEILTDKDKFNEYIFTKLRTSNGINVKIFQEDKHKRQLNFIEELNKNLFITKNGDKIILTKKGMLIADKIISKLFV